MNISADNLKKTLHRLAEADMVFFIMPALMILLVIGTVAQSWIGLYAAHQNFFASFIAWLGPVPIPGGYTLLGILSFNLALKFLLKSNWNWQKSGINLSHLGALVLLIGGLATAISARESYMVIPEGTSTPYIYSYNSRELVIYKNDLETITIPFEELETTTIKNLPFEISVIETYENSEINKREETANYDPEKSYQSMAKFMALSNKKTEKEPEENIAGLTFEIAPSDTSENFDTLQTGLYIAFDGMPKPIEIKYKNDTYRIIFGKAQTLLPFSIALQDFVKESYSGIDMAKNYHSDVIVQDNTLEWPVRIEMNSPLRYRGYTFFQSSFEQTPETEITILAVVENKGWLLPYIGTLIIGAGLILHLLLTLYGRRNA